MKSVQIIDLSFECTADSYAAELSAMLADRFGHALYDPKESYGIYLSTASAGIDESVEFWKNTLRQTPAFVNPSTFPYTLSNAPASCIAKALGIKGPVYTLSGNKDAIGACFLNAESDMEARIVKHAFIVAFDRVDNRIQLNGFLMNGLHDKYIASLRKLLNEALDNYPSQVMRSILGKMNMKLSSIRLY